MDNNNNNNDNNNNNNEMKGSDDMNNNINIEWDYREDLDLAVNNWVENCHVDDPMSWFNGWRLNKEGGLIFENEEVLKKQKGVFKEVLKNFSAAVLSGQGTVSLSLPIRIFEPQSMLERVTLMWGFLPTFIPRASEAQPGSLERFSWCLSFVLGGLHFCLNQLKPFNPILGETYNGYFQDGTKVFIEHTSHHPPICNFLVEHPQNLFRMYGAYCFGASYSAPNSVLNTQRGTTYIEFPDGEKISFTLPYVKMTGFFVGNRVVEWLGELEMESTNGFICNIKFDPDSGLGNLFKRNSKKSDCFKGQILDKNQVKETEKKKSSLLSMKSSNKIEYECIAEVTGSWLEKVTINDRDYWVIENDLSYKCQASNHPLPSDCRYRIDLSALKDNDEELAQRNKIELEVLQRADRADRIKYIKEHPDEFENTKK